MLTNQQPLLTSSAAFYKWDKKVAKRFTFMDNYGDIFNMWHQKGDYLLLPRNGCPTGEKDGRVSGLPTLYPTSSYKQQKPDQDRVIFESLKLLAADESFVIQAYTGFGKTVIGSHLMGARGLKSLVICTKMDILNQWKDSLRMLFDFKESEIGLIQGPKVRTDGCPVTLCLVQTVYKENRMPYDLAKQFGMVVSDEVHRMSAEKFSMAMWYQPGIIRLGLSATPYRKDGRDPVFFNHIGPVKVIAKGHPMPFKVMFYRTKWGPWKSGGVQVPHKIGRTMHINKMLAGVTRRNAVILSVLKAMWEADRNLVIFSETLAHLKVLRGAIVKMGVPESDTSFFVGGLTEKQQKVAKSKTLVFATYKMTSEGTDAPWWDACLFAQPRADVVQIVGRVTREYPGKKTPVVIDLIDQSPVFEIYWKKRLKWYKTQKAEIGELY